MRYAFFLILFSLTANAAEPVRCPPAMALRQLTIEDITDNTMPVFERWQAFLGDVPLSDRQVVMLAGNDKLEERVSDELRSRGLWVYLGMGTAALGTAVSSAGWALYGQGSAKTPPSVTLPLALVGLAIGVSGVLWAMQSIQTPLEPHLAPTPKHRLTREEMGQLVAAINRNWYREICVAVETANSGK